MARRTFAGIAFAESHARHRAGTPARVTAGAVEAACFTASGRALPARTSGTPCNSSGRTRFENPYEWASEIAPIFGHSGRKPIVLTMFTASAANCSPVNAESRGPPVLAEVVLR